MFLNNSPLVLLFALVLQLNFGQATVAAGCSLPPYNGGRPKCNETCSKPARIPFANDFKCTVGSRVEWLDFKNRYEIQQANVVNDTSLITTCSVSLLTGISLHALPYNPGGRFSPALRASFNASFRAKLAQPELKAILLEFESPIYRAPDTKKYTDTAYSVQNDNSGGGRQRLFDFSMFEPDSYDIEHPITIEYPCLYGLDDCEGGKVYTITLTSVMMAMKNSKVDREYFKCNSDSCATCSQMFTISVTPTRYNNWNRNRKMATNPNYVDWYMTIATALYPVERDIYVLVEKPPENISFDFYVIRLVKDRYKVKENNITETSHIFKAISHGNYTIEVLLCRHSGFCSNKYNTYHTVVIEDKDQPRTESTKQIVLTSILASVLGAVLALFFLMLLVWFRCSRKKNSRNGSGIEETPYVILSSSDTASNDISQKLTIALKELGIQNVRCPTTYSEALECIKSNDDTYVVIMLPVKHKSIHFQISTDIEFEQFLTSLFNFGLNLKNVLTISFPYMKGAKQAQCKYLRKYKHIYLMRDYDKMVKLLKIKTNDSRILEEVRSYLEIATKEAKRTLKTYSYPSTKMKTARSPENIERCPIHSPPRTVCQVHNNNNYSIQTRPNMYYYMNEQHGYHNNNSMCVRNNEISPLLDPVIIPPSPMPSIKNKQTVEYHRGDSGYCTSPSRRNSETYESDINRQLSLEDDDSLHEGIMQINSNLLPKGSQKEHKKHEHIRENDRAFDINFN